LKIIQPSFKLVTPFGPLTEERGIELLRFIEANARISHRSEGAQTQDSWRRFLHEVVVKHADYSVAQSPRFFESIAESVINWSGIVCLRLRRRASVS